MDDALVRVLLVDDEVRVLEGLERQLSFDFSIATATSGFDALRMLRDDGPFDVVISELGNPPQVRAQQPTGTISALDRCLGLSPPVQ